MSERDHRQRRNEKTLEDLPPRVVIYDILNYHEVTLDYSLGEFDLFGYYRRDRHRNVWFFFQSLVFLSHFYTQGTQGTQQKSTFPLVKIEKLHSLRIRGESRLPDFYAQNRFFKSFLDAFKQTNMYLLKRLSTFESTDYVGLFSKQNRFPKLAHLEIRFTSTSLLKDWKWDEERIKSLHRTLTSLQVESRSTSRQDTIEIVNYLGLRIFGNENTFDSLKKIQIINIHFLNRRTIHVPLLEQVYVSDCRNMVLIPGKNVISLFSGGNHPEDINNLILRSRRFKHLLFTSYELFEESNEWLWEESTNPMEHLVDLFVRDYNVKSKGLDNFLERVKNQLIRFGINSCTSLPDLLFKDGFEKLEYLSFFGETPDSVDLLIKNPNWKFSSQLKELSINVLYWRHRILFNCSRLFSMNDFSSLQVLKLVGCYYVGSTTTSFPFIKALTVDSHIGDIFFVEKDFENVEILEIKSPNIQKQLTGKGWRRTRFKKVRELRVNGDSFSNDLFGRIEFPVLELLHLSYCHEITGVGWLPLPKLRDFISIFSSGFSKEKALEMRENDPEMIRMDMADM